LQENYGLGDTEKDLDFERAAEANAELLQVMQAIDREWQTVSQFDQSLVDPNQDVREPVWSAVSQMSAYWVTSQRYFHQDSQWELNRFTIEWDPSSYAGAWSRPVPEGNDG
jgi:hypothetical protein